MNSSFCTFTVLHRTPKALRIKIHNIENFGYLYLKIFEDVSREYLDRYLKCMELWIPVSTVRDAWDYPIFVHRKGKKSLGGPWKARIWNKVLFTNIKKMVEKRIKGVHEYDEME
jgi:hypothetical protein